jgi:uracil-DNA glycosylase
VVGPRLTAQCEPTGRPFTGDFAGDLLYETLIAVRARPPSGRPTVPLSAPQSSMRCAACRRRTSRRSRQLPPYLKAAIAHLPKLDAVVALGKIAHDSVTRAFGLPAARLAFGHGARHVLPTGITLFDSYHCSRYNTNTGVLTPEMFRAVFSSVADHLGSRS